MLRNQSLKRILTSYLISTKKYVGKKTTLFTNKNLEKTGLIVQGAESRVVSFKVQSDVALTREAIEEKALDFSIRFPRQRSTLCPDCAKPAKKLLRNKQQNTRRRLQRLNIMRARPDSFLILKNDHLELYGSYSLDLYLVSEPFTQRSLVGIPTVQVPFAFSAPPVCVHLHKYPARQKKAPFSVRGT
jgi:hypothetical protein